MIRDVGGADDRPGVVACRTSDNGALARAPDRRGAGLSVLGGPMIEGGWGGGLGVTCVVRPGLFRHPPGRKTSRRPVRGNSGSRHSGSRHSGFRRLGFGQKAATKRRVRESTGCRGYAPMLRRGCARLGEPRCLTRPGIRAGPHRPRSWPGCRGVAVAAPGRSGARRAPPGPDPRCARQAWRGCRPA